MGFGEDGESPGRAEEEEDSGHCDHEVGEINER